MRRLVPWFLLALPAMLWAQSLSDREITMMPGANDPGDLILSWAMSEDHSPVTSYQPPASPYSGVVTNASPPVMGSGTEQFAEAQLSYSIPTVAPLGVALLAGCASWQDVGATSATDLPMSAGIAAQAGMTVTLKLGNLFLQGVGLWRPFGWAAGSAAGSGTEGPYGSYSLMALGRFSLN